MQKYHSTEFKEGRHWEKLVFKIRKSLTTLEYSFISNKAEPEGKGFYRWVGVKEIRAAGVDNLFIVEFCYHHELQSDVGMKSYWLGSVSLHNH